MTLADQFSTQIETAESELRAIAEAVGSEPYRIDGWMRKELLGHLLDSALHNHMRFGLAMIQGELHYPNYDQEAWVRVHDYAGVEWRELVDYWCAANHRLARLVARMQPAHFAIECNIGSNSGANPTMTLRALAEDYLRHMRHHMDQIGGGVSAPNTAPAAGSA